MFLNRAEAAHQLAQRLKGQPFRDPLILGIPRGGVVLGAVLARELGADLDVVLSRKLHVPQMPELALGAISETGEIYLDRSPQELGISSEYIQEECRNQLAEIDRRARLFRAVRPRAPVAGRSVMVTDDGIATGSTLIAALRALRGEGPAELLVAVPVAAADRLESVRRCCDEVVCLLAPEEFWAVSQFYLDFQQVEDDEVVEMLRPFAPVVFGV